MELPKPPEDQELRNIVDKLAQFVARNGPEFEQMTKNKQKDNPKFAFLFGGEYFNYYQYKVTTEQASEFILKQKQKALEQQQAIVQQAITRQSIKSAPWQSALQQQQMQEQIQQSDRNLAAQHHVLMQQQQLQVDDVIRKAQEENLHGVAAECDIDLQEMDRIMQPIIDSCTKDAISAGKGWIFSHSNDIKSNSVIARYLLRSMRKGAEQLKKALEKAVVPIFCTTSLGASDEQKQKLAKLLKLWESNKYFEPTILEQLKNPAASLAAYQALLITEHAKLVTPIVTAIQSQYTALQKQHQEFVAHVTAQLQLTLQAGTGAGSSGGAPAGVQPVVPSDIGGQTVASINALVATFGKVTTGMSPPTTSDANTPATTSPAQSTSGVVAPSATSSQQSTLQQQQPPPPLLPYTQPPPLPLSQPQQQTYMQPPPNFAQPPPNFGQPPPCFPPSFPISSAPPNYSQPPPIGMPPPPPYGPSMDPPPPFPTIPQQQNGLPLPDLSKPPPGFPPVGVAASPLLPMPLPPPLPDPIELLPAVPYFELPAALMVPLVKLEDDEYKSLDPNDIRLPPPAPPSERLLAAVELFYSPPGHDRPRNRNWENRENCDVKSNYVATSREGWEQLGLYEFFKAKHQAKKVKEDEIRDGRRQRSRSRSTSGERTNSYHRTQSRSPPRRRYREFTSRSKSRSKSRSRSRSLSPSRSRSQSRSPSASPVRPLVAAGSDSQSPSRSRSASPVTSPTQSAFKQQRPPSSRSPSRSRSRSRSTSKSPSPSRLAQTSRSPTPPSFFGGAYPTTSIDRRLDESNIGHQLLRKMGWGGAGLGAAEQGIQDPISGGEIRDRQDQYKGIGISLNDPFENFRKSKGQAFINRMKARAEEKTT